VTRPRLAAIDLDGTLLRSDRTVSDRSRAAIAAARAAGIDVVVATARSPRGARDLAADAGIGGLAICANGATVYDLEANRIVVHTPLPAETAHVLVRGLRERFPDVVFGWEYELRFGSEPAYEAQRDPSWWPRPEGSYEPCDPLDWDLPMTKLLARLPEADLEHVLAVATELAGGEASTTLAGTAFVELAAAGVGKETALARLAGEAGVPAEEVVAFGDHVTDVAMLEWAGHGVAVANAHPAALAVADEVAPSNDDDGVAVVLERLVRGFGLSTGFSGRGVTQERG
jgi:Cof subfamily protein (haloacid dehalogenase superfamily)